MKPKTKYLAVNRSPIRYNEVKMIDEDERLMDAGVFAGSKLPNTLSEKQSS
jgi:hypothetical protein